MNYLEVLHLLDPIPQSYFSDLDKKCLIINLDEMGFLVKSVYQRFEEGFEDKFHQKNKDYLLWKHIVQTNIYGVSRNPWITGISKVGLNFNRISNRLHLKTLYSFNFFKYWDIKFDTIILYDIKIDFDITTLLKKDGYILKLDKIEPLYEVKNRFSDFKELNAYNEIFECPLCKIEYHRLERFLIHIEKAHNFSCLYCDKRFEYEKQLNDHVKKYHQIYICSCGEVFYSKEEKIKHRHPYKKNKEKIKKPFRKNEAFICPICKLEYKMPYHLEKPHNFECPHCDIKFIDKFCLKNHIKHRHPYKKNEEKIKKPFRKNEAFICPICNLEYKNPYHLKKPHNFECPHCDIKFTDKFCLKIHIKNDHKDKKINKLFECPICKEKYLQLNHMKKPHIFKCSYCDRSFTDKFSLKVHTNNNHQIYVCKTCGEVFHSKEEIHAHGRHRYKKKLKN